MLIYIIAGVISSIVLMMIHFYRKKIETFCNVKKKICICMSHTENIYEYSKLTERINKEYAIKHGYDFQIFNLEMKDRAPQWCKIDVINRLLDENDINKYEYLFWIDADAFFNKHDVRLETFITDSEKNIIICDDVPNSGKENTINTGTFFVKCNDWSKKFFKDLWNYDGEYLYKHFHEQTMIEHSINDNIMDAKKYIEVKPASTFNSDINQIYDGSVKDTFLIHLMALSSEFRVEYINNWMKENGLL